MPEGLGEIIDDLLSDEEIVYDARLAFEALDRAVAELPMAKDWYDRTHVFNLCNMGLSGFLNHPPWSDSDHAILAVTLPQSPPRWLRGNLPVARAIK
jgi:hypothetical protein